MNRLFLSFLVLVALLANGQDNHPAVDAPSVTALQNAISRLNKEVADLTKKNEGLTNRVSALDLEAAPVGAIMAFAGPIESIPSTWRLCNGDPIARSPEYDALFQAIKTSWGGNQSTFYLPDLRGRFLRGVDQGANRDPDVGQRTADRPGANALDRVGSMQGDALQNHRHDDSGHNHGSNISTLGYRDSFACGNRCGAVTVEATPTVTIALAKAQITEPTPTSNNSPIRVAPETRVKNAYVYWIIRVK